jgi:hypothetical protein
MAEPLEWFTSIPLITRMWIVAAVGTSILVVSATGYPIHC